jgi:hypothetical protein
MHIDINLSGTLKLLCVQWHTWTGGIQFPYLVLMIFSIFSILVESYPVHAL